MSVRDAFEELLGTARCESTLRVTQGSVSLHLYVASGGGGCWRGALMRTSPEEGRYMVAASRIETGSVVCKAPAHCVCAFEEWRKRACACCFVISTGRLTIRCPECEHAFYCSHECRSSHLLEGSNGTAPHAHLCGALRKFAPLRKFGKPTANVLRLLLENLAVRYAEKPALEGLVKSDAAPIWKGGTPTAWGPGSPPPPGELPVTIGPSAQLGTRAAPDCSGSLDCARKLRGGGTPCPNAVVNGRLFDALQHHHPKWSQPKEALEWAKACAIFRTVLSHTAWWGQTLRALPTDSELFSVVSRLDSNIFGCFVRDGGPLFGHACYLQAATFNHSCAANCSATSGVGCIEIIADEDVREGEQLSISYIDANKPRDARRKILQEHYNFQCRCSRCATEASAAGRAKMSYHTGRGGREALGARGSQARSGAMRQAVTGIPSPSFQPPGTLEQKAHTASATMGYGGVEVPLASAGVPWFEALA